jgi:hypothetical protein
MISAAEVLPQSVTDLADQAEENLVDAYTPEAPSKDAKPVLTPDAPEAKPAATK